MCWYVTNSKLRSLSNWFASSNNSIMVNDTRSDISYTRSPTKITIYIYSNSSTSFNFKCFSMSSQYIIRIFWIKFIYCNCSMMRWSNNYTIVSRNSRSCCNSKIFYYNTFIIRRITCFITIIWNNFYFKFITIFSKEVFSIVFSVMKNSNSLVLCLLNMDNELLVKLRISISTSRFDSQSIIYRNLFVLRSMNSRFVSHIHIDIKILNLIEVYCYFNIIDRTDKVNPRIIITKLNKVTFRNHRNLIRFKEVYDSKSIIHQ